MIFVARVDNFMDAQEKGRNINLIKTFGEQLLLFVVFLELSFIL